MTLAVLSLLTADSGAVVSVELFDDVSVQRTDGKAVLKQAKSATSSNPISNRSVGLWKSMANWADAVSTNQVPHGCFFQMWVTPKRSGNLIGILDSAKTEAEVEAAYQLAMKETLNHKRLGETVRPFVEAFFAAEKTIACFIIKNFSFHPCSKRYQQELEVAFGRKWVTSELRKVVGQACAGWVHEKINESISSRVPVAIAVSDFDDEMAKNMRMFNTRGVLGGIVAEPDYTEIQAASAKLFVRQMEIIELSDDLKESGVKDFLMAASYRTLVAEAGDVAEHSIAEFMSELQKGWSFVKLECDASLPAAPREQRGRLVFSKCMQLRPPLENMQVPGFFAPGCLHDLSNRKSLGWHPNWEDLL